MSNTSIQLGSLHEWEQLDQGEKYCINCGVSSVCFDDENRDVCRPRIELKSKESNETDSHLSDS
jgi:hypothetical protein